MRAFSLKATLPVLCLFIWTSRLSAQTTSTWTPDTLHTQGGIFYWNNNNPLQTGVDSMLQNNWSCAAPPNSIGAVANMNANDLTQNETVWLSANATIGVLNIGDTTSSNGYFLRAAGIGTTGTLTFDNTGYSSGSSALNTAVINNSGGLNEISAPITLNSSLDIYNTSASPLVFRPLTSASFNLGTGNTLSFKSGSFVLDNSAGSVFTAVSSDTVRIESGATVTLTNGANTASNNALGSNTLATEPTMFIAGTLKSAGNINLPQNATNVVQNGGTNHIGAITLDGGTITSTMSPANTYYGDWLMDGNVTVGGSGTTSTSASTISGNLLNLNGSTRTFTVNNVTGSSAADLNVSAAIMGSSGNWTSTAGLTKAGNGTLQLSAANPYSGNTTINDGVIDLNHFNALQNSLVALGTTTFTTAGSPLTFSAGAGTYSIGGLSGGNSAFTPKIDFSGNTLNLQGNLTTGAQTFGGTAGGAFTGNGSMAMNGKFAQILAGDNSSYSGTITVSKGWLRGDNANLAGNSTAGNSGTANSTSLTVGTVANFAVGQVISGTGIVAGTTITGITGNVLTLSAPLSGTASGTYTSTSGNTALGTGAITVNSGGTLQTNLLAAGAIGNNFTLNGIGSDNPTAYAANTANLINPNPGAVAANGLAGDPLGREGGALLVGGNTTTFTGGITIGSTNTAINVAGSKIATFNGVISDGGSAYNVIFNRNSLVNQTGKGSAAGTIILDSNNTYTGSTTVGSGALTLNFNSGVSGLSQTDIINSASTLKLGSLANDGATLNVNGINAAGASTQNLNGVQIMGGTNVITPTKGTNAANTVVLNMGSLSQATAGAGIVGVTANTGTTVNTTTANAYGTSGSATGGYIGAWATSGTGTGANTWLGSASTGTSAATAAFTGWTVNNAVNTWTSGATSYANGAALTGALAGNTAIDSMRFNFNTSSTLDLGTNTLTLNSGGLINTSAISTSTNTTTISNGNLTSGSGTVYVYQNAAGPLTISANITNNGATPTGLTVSKTGGTTAVFTLSGNNTYTGDTNLLTGQTTLGSATALAGQGNMNVYNPATLRLNGFSATVNGLSGAGTVDNNAGTPSTLTVGAGNATSTFDGIITQATAKGATAGAGAGDLSLVKTGSGTLTLTATTGNTYAGTVAVNGGTLRIYGDLALGVAPTGVSSNAITLNGGTLETSANMTLNTYRGIVLGSGNGSINVDANTVLTTAATNVISGAGSLTKSGNGNLILGGAQANTYTGGTIMNGGLVQISADQALGAVPGAAGTNVTFAANSTLQFAVSTTLNAARGIAINNSVTATFDSGSTTDVIAGVISGAGNVNILGAVDTPSGSGVNFGTSSAPVINTYTGTTTINKSAVLSVYSLSSAVAIADGLGTSAHTAGGLIIDGGSFRYSGVSTTTDRLFTMGVNGAMIDSAGSSNATLNMSNTGAIGFTGTTTSGRTLTLAGGGTGFSTFAPKITDNNTAGGDTTALTILAGNWNLPTTAATNSYSGGTNIYGGTLRIQASATMNIGATGTASSIGTADPVLNGGTLSFAPNVSGSRTFNVSRAFQLGTSGGTIDATQNGTSNTTIVKLGTAAQSMGFNGQYGPRNLIITGTAGSNSVIGTTSATAAAASEILLAIGDNGGATSITKNNTSIWNLSNANNTFTGTLTISGGEIRVTSMPLNGGVASQLGAGNNNPEAIVLNGGFLRTDVTANTDTNRLFSLGTSGGGLDSSGTAAIRYLNTGPIGYNNATGTRTLTLTGNATAGITAANPNILSAAIGDNGGATSVIVTSDQAGGTGGTTYWKLDGKNTFTGTLEVGSRAPITGSSAQVIIGSNATLAPQASVLVDPTGSVAFQSNQSLDKLSGYGKVDVTGSILQVGANNSSSTFNGTTTAGTIVKSGTGDLALGSANGTSTTAFDVQQGSVTLRNTTALGTTAAKFADGTTLNFANEGFLVRAVSTTTGGDMTTTALNASQTNSAVTTDTDMVHSNSLLLIGTNTTWGYASQMVVNGGTTAGSAGTWNFGKSYDDAALIKVGAATVINNTASGNVTGAQATVSTGLNALELRVGNNTGAAGYANGANATIGGLAFDPTGTKIAQSAFAPSANNLLVTAISGSTVTVASGTGLTTGMIVTFPGGATATVTAVTPATGATVVTLSTPYTGAVNSSFTAMNYGPTSSPNSSSTAPSVSVTTTTGLNTMNSFTETAGGGAQKFLAWTNGTVINALQLTGNVNVSTAQLYDGMNNAYNIKLDGVISGTGGLTVSGYDTGVTNVLGGGRAGTGLILNAANTFTGDTNVSSGILEVRNTNALQYSTLNLTGTGAFNIGPAGSVGAANGLTASSALSTGLVTALPDVVLGGLSGTSSFKLSTTETTPSDVDLIVGGNNASTTFSGTLSDTNNASTVTKKGTGTLSLTATDSTYGGATTIESGVLAVAQLADGGVASSIGDSSNAASNLVLGTASTTGTLRLTGSAASTTDRLFTVNAGGGVIENNGSGALNFTNTAAATVNGNLTLGGTSTATSTMNPILGGSGSLTKTGTNTWILNAANTYSGITTVTNGTLQVGDGTNTTASLGSGAVTNNATLDFNHNGNVTVTNNISGTGRTVQDGTGILTLSGSLQQSNGLAVNTGAVLLNTVGNPSFGPEGAALGSYTPGTASTTGGTGTSTATTTVTNYQGVTIANGATLDLNSKDLGATNVTVGGSGSTANGYTGALINNSGTTAIINGSGGLTSVKLPGTGVGGLTGAATLTLSAGDTLGSGGAVTGTYSVETVGLTTGGSGYTSVPTVTISGSTTGSAAQANVTMALKTTATSPGNITLNGTDALGRSGSGYLGVPTVTINGAAATASMGVNTAKITTPGTCYPNGTYALNFTGGGGTGAAGTATTADNGATWTINITSAGSGYTSPPTFTVGTAGSTSSSGNVATGVINDLSVVGVTVTSGVTGLTSLPTVTIAPPTSTSATNLIANTGVQATASATLSVDQITLTNPGSGYDVSGGLPTIALSGGGGTGAGVSLNTVALTALNVTAGSGYANNSTAQGVLPGTLPSVTVSGGGLAAPTTLETAAQTVLLTADTKAGGTGDLLIGGRVADGTATSANTGTATSGIIKVGSGTLTLSADNTYTGVTNITAGKVTLANGSTLGSIDDSKTVAVAGGATLDTGRTGTASYKFDGVLTGGTTSTAGTVTGNITITGTQQGAIAGVGQLRPGTSSDLTSAGNTPSTSGDGIGTLNFTNNLTMSGNSTAFMKGSASGSDIGASAAFGVSTAAYDAYVAAALSGWESNIGLNATSSTHDRISINGTLDVQSGSMLDLSGLTGMAAGDVFDLLDWVNLSRNWTTNVAANYGTGQITTGGIVGDLILPTLSSDLKWDVQFWNTHGILVVVVPEPSRALLLMIGLGSLIVRRQRRHAQTVA